VLKKLDTADIVRDGDISPVEREIAERWRLERNEIRP
jgi:hypothetical protein